MLSLAPGLFAGKRNLIRVVLRLNRLTAVGPGVFDGCTKLLYLDFSENNLVAATLANLPALFGLDLSSNNLTDPATVAVSATPQLGQLDLSLNMLRSIAGAALPPSLTLLGLRGNPLEPDPAMPATLAAMLPRLQTLQVDGSPLAPVLEVPLSEWPSFAALKAVATNLTAVRLLAKGPHGNLTELVLGRNRLTAAPFGLTAAIKLVVLDLSFNSITGSSLAELALPASLQRLDLNNNPLRHVPAGLLGNCTALQTLSLVSCKLTLLSKGLFDGLAQLSELYLDTNGITVFPPRLFLPLRMLDVLRLDGGGSLSESLAADPALFQNLTTLTILSIGDLGLSVVPPDLLVGLGALQTLVLGPNELTALPNRLLLPAASLIQLDLCGTAVASMGPTPRSLAELSVCDGTFDLNISAILGAAPSITTLDLSRSNGSAVTNLLAAGTWGPELELLDLSFTGLGQLRPGMFARANSLATLVLEGNPQLSLVKSGFDGLSSLRSLDLSSLGLTVIPTGAFATLTSLSTLNLANNALVGVDPAQLLPAEAALTSVQLSGNRLTRVPMLAARQLQNFELNDNQLTVLYRLTFDECASVLILALANNSITLLEPGVFSRTSSLSLLDLSMNQLANIGAGVLTTAESWNSIKELELGGNRLTMVPADIRVLGNLTSLDLSFNRITSVLVDDLSGTQALRTLLLGDNDITSIAPTTFRNSRVLRCKAASKLLLDPILCSPPSSVYRPNIVCDFSAAYNSPPVTVAWFADLHLWRNKVAPGSVPQGLFANNSGLTALHAFQSGLNVLPPLLTENLGYLKEVTLFGTSTQPERLGSLTGYTNPLLRVRTQPPQAYEAAPQSCSGPRAFSGALLFAAATWPAFSVVIPPPFASFLNTRGVACQCSDATWACTCTFCGPGHAVRTPAASAVGGSLGGGGHCNPCPAGGYYQDEVAAPTCKRCPNGSFAPLPGATAVTACQACPSGTNTAGPISTLGCPCLHGYHRPTGNPSNFTACVWTGLGMSG